MTKLQNERRSKLDPFTAEVIKEALVAIGDEMFVAMQRTSMSTIIYEVLDYGIGLVDVRGQLVSQGQGVTAFIGTLTEAVKTVLSKFGSTIRPGDVYITNDPYSGGGTHLSDVSIAVPIFQSEKLIMFSVAKAHWTEVGGMRPGSWSTDSTEIYQEGLQFPCVRLYQQGSIDQALVDIIRSNVRLPDMTLGDLHAQVAAVRLGERRFNELCAKYGTAVVLEAVEWMYEYSERMTRLELANLPKGTYEATDWIDDDGMGNGPFEIKVKVTVTDDKFVCDFTGSAAQARGPINNTRTGLLSAVRILFKGLTSPAIPANEGCFKMLEIVCPDGTVFTAIRPAPVSVYWESLLFAAELVWKALAAHVPERLTAGSMVSVCGTIIAGTHPDTGGLFVLVEPEVGGWGATASFDGLSGVFALPDAATQVIPVEVTETRYGVLVEQFSFDTSVAAGAGRFRGGRGCIREYRLLSDDAFVTSTAGRHKFLPWGVGGGQPGSRNAIEVVRMDGTVEDYGMAAQVPLRRGDRVRIVTATGGGWGNPFSREVSAIVDDVRDGLVTPDQAQNDYGVRLDPATFQVLELAPGRQS